MNDFTKALFAPFAKALTVMRHPTRSTLLSGLLRRTRFDYRAEVGDKLDSSVVTAPIMFIQRSLPEARLALRRRLRSGQVEELPDHDMLALIRRPNDFYGDIALWFGTVLSYLLDGNAYWIKVRNRAGQVVELWYVPHWMIEPWTAGDGSAFLDHYRYNPGGGIMRLEPEDVVHFRHGLNPRNLLKGISPLDGALREIFMDLEASNFVASLLRNMGVPGVVISPKGGAMPSADDVEATKAWFKQAFGGDNRGGVLVMGGPTDVQPYGFNPQQMNMSEARDIAEERICACLGVPAAVVGFGAGLQQTKVGATMEELRKLAWHNGVLPVARSLADELQRSLLPDFERGAKSDALDLFWDTDDVLALQEDENKATERKLNELKAGAIMLYDYLVETGRPADDSHKIYLRPISSIEVPASQLGKAPPADMVGGKALPAPGVKADGHAGHSHAPLPDNARRASEAAMKKGEAWVLLLQRQERGLQASFAKVLEGLFAKWGDQASAVALAELRFAGLPKERKADGGSTIDDLLKSIMDKLDSDAWRMELEQAYGAHYLQTAQGVQGAAEQLGLGTGLPDPVMRAIVASGGRRVGLLDLDAQTRRAVFDALAEGRIQGEGAEALANRIANMVEGGPWSDGITRARVIARTETKFAQNLSTIQSGLAAGVTDFIIFDGRLGPGRSLESHMARNGMIVPAEQALVIAAEEHPNGTLSFAPSFDL